MQQRKKRARISVPVSAELLVEIQKEARRGRLSVSKAAQQVIERGLAVIRRTELERALREGYRALADEDGALAEEMAPVASEPWEN